MGALVPGRVDTYAEPGVRHVRIRSRGERASPQLFVGLWVINFLRGCALALILMGRPAEALARTEETVATFNACDDRTRIASRAAGQDAGQHVAVRVVGNSARVIANALPPEAAARLAPMPLPSSDGGPYPYPGDPVKDGGLGTTYGGHGTTSSVGPP